MLLREFERFWQDWNLIWVGLVNVYLLMQGFFPFLCGWSPWKDTRMEYRCTNLQECIWIRKVSAAPKRYRIILNFRTGPARITIWIGVEWLVRLVLTFTNLLSNQRIQLRARFRQICEVFFLKNTPPVSDAKSLKSKFRSCRNCAKSFKFSQKHPKR